MDLIDLPELPGNASPDRGIHAMRAMERRALIVRDTDALGRLLTNRQVLRAWADHIEELKDAPEATTLAAVSLNDILSVPLATSDLEPMRHLRMQLRNLSDTKKSQLEQSLDVVAAMYGSEPQVFSPGSLGVRLILTRNESKAIEVGSGPLLCICDLNKHESGLPPAADGGTCLDCKGTYRCA